MWYDIFTEYFPKGDGIMKLIFAIINDEDVRAVSEALIENELTSTRLSSTGSFLKAGNTTLLICLEDEKVDTAIELIKSHCKRRKQLLPSSHIGGAFSTYPVEITLGGATVFVTDVERFEKF